MAEAWFWNRIAKRYAKMPISDEASYQTKLEKTRSYLTPTSIVLEFGCGTGNTALKHAPFVQHIDAIDISSGMLDQCRQRLAQTDIQNVHFQQATIESFQSPMMVYDVILGMSILHLVDNRHDVLKKVYDLLKPGGYFMSSTICLADTSPWFWLILKPGRLLRLLPKIDCLSKSELIHNLSEAGFQLELEWQPTPKAAVFLIAKKPSLL